MPFLLNWKALTLLPRASNECPASQRVQGIRVASVFATWWWNEVLHLFWSNVWNMRLCAATLPAQDTDWEPQPASLAPPNSSRPGNNDRSQEQGTCARSSRDAVGHLAEQSKWDETLWALKQLALFDVCQAIASHVDHIQKCLYQMYLIRAYEDRTNHRVTAPSKADIILWTNDTNSYSLLWSCTPVKPWGPISDQLCTICCPKNGAAPCSCLLYAADALVLCRLGAAGRMWRCSGSGSLAGI